MALAHGPVADYSAARPSPATLLAHGYTDVCRYLCPENSLTAFKLLRAPEITALHGGGLGVNANFESYESRPLEGAAAGHVDGTFIVAAMDALAQSLGYPYWPKGAKIPWSFDQYGTFAQCSAYGAAFAAPVRAAGHRPVMYGGSVAGHPLLDAGIIDDFWQASAMSWSDYQDSPRAGWIQRLTARIPDVDHNDRMRDDIGAWRPDGIDTGDDMPAPKDWDAADWAAHDKHTGDAVWNAIMASSPVPADGGKPQQYGLVFQWLVAMAARQLAVDNAGKPTSASLSQDLRNVVNDLRLALLTGNPERNDDGSYKRDAAGNLIYPIVAPTLGGDLREAFGIQGGRETAEATALTSLQAAVDGVAAELANGTPNNTNGGGGTTGPVDLTDDAVSKVADATAGGVLSRFKNMFAGGTQ